MAKQSEKVKFSKKRVKQLSKQRKKKQADIAALLDRSLDTVKGIYREEMILPEHLEIIGKELDASVDYLKGKISVPAMLSDNCCKYNAGESISEDRIDPDGYIIPHYKHQYFWDQMANKQNEEMDSLIKWLEDSRILLTASGYIDQDYSACLESIKKNDYWIRQALVYLIVYSCGPKKDIEDYVLERFKDFWDSAYLDMKREADNRNNGNDESTEENEDSCEIETE